MLYTRANIVKKCTIPLAKIGKAISKIRSMRNKNYFIGNSTRKKKCWDLIRIINRNKTILRYFGDIKSYLLLWNFF